MTGLNDVLLQLIQLRALILMSRCEPADVLVDVVHSVLDSVLVHRHPSSNVLQSLCQLGSLGRGDGRVGRVGRVELVQGTPVAGDPRFQRCESVAVLLIHLYSLLVIYVRVVTDVCHRRVCRGKVPPPCLVDEHVFGVELALPRDVRPEVVADLTEVFPQFLNEPTS
jgi:hypothetical protein